MKYLILCLCLLPSAVQAQLPWQHRVQPPHLPTGPSYADQTARTPTADQIMDDLHRRQAETAHKEEQARLAATLDDLQFDADVDRWLLKLLTTGDKQ
jgi:hypothetical protein